MNKRSIFYVLTLVFSIVFASPGTAAQKPNEALVTFMEGSAQVFTNDKTAGQNIKKGDKLRREHEVRVGDRSRIEIRFPDGTIMRLSEKSRLAMSELQYDRKTESKKVNVSLGVGKLWAKVKKLVTPDSSVQVNIGNAVAGVRGTVYRMDVEDDSSATVKVYDGSVYVASPPKGETGKQQTELSTPVPVPGPHEVPPPMHEVTVEEWHVIVKAMQEINISPQGVASQPQDFDAKTDADDWVKWNQERDRQNNL